MRAFRKHKRKFGIVTLLALLAQVLAPLQSFAITGHDSMPEYRSFEPVATTNMVNVFDGSFTYNIPILDVPNGYPITLSYHSNDVTTDAQASWVGLGWTLNPGSINRMKRGFPDDFNKQNVTYHNRMPANWTISAEGGVTLEALGKEELVDLGFSASKRYNNYSGIGTSVHANLELAGAASLDLNYAQGRFGFSPEINPAGLMHTIKKIKSRKDKKTEEKDPKDENSKDREKELADASNEYVRQLQEEKPLSRSHISFSFGGARMGSNGSLFTPVGAAPPTSYSTSQTPYTGFMVNLKYATGINPLPVPVDAEQYVNGGYVWQKQDEEQTVEACGYMFNEEALGDAERMMDFFTENDSPFEKRDNILGIPLPNNDLYSLTGEAMGGTFRPFRSEFGTYRQNRAYSDDISINASADVNLASVVTFPPFNANLVYSSGFEVGGNYHWLDIGDWDPGKLTSDDNNFKFVAPSHSYVANSSNENWFFRFSGDLGGDFDLTNTDYVNNDSPFRVTLDKTLAMRAEIDYTGWSNMYGVSNSYLIGRNNKKRSSYVSYATVDDAQLTSNTHRYKLYQKHLHVKDGDNPNTIDYFGSNFTYYDGNNGNAIQELVSNNADGVTYVYGLPVYARNEKQLSYSLRKGNDFDVTQLNTATDGGGLIAKITGTNIDASAKRKTGFESNTAYASNYLLTQILSPDYIDREMDGPTPDDFGSYTQFNYARHAGGSGNNWFPFRTPYEGVSFSYGSLSINGDDMGSFSYGEKEIYYVQSIASKTHAAIFTLEDREDGMGAKLTPGAASADELLKGDDGSTPMKLKRLKKIDLYAIGDVEEVTTGSGIYRPRTGAVPIKTVHFEYTYELCKNLDNNSQKGVDYNNSGKLTLKKVWFEYEGKLTSKISPYIFEYAYPTTSYPAPYNTGNINSYTSFAGIQNPDYNVLNTDRWGNYRDYATHHYTTFGDLARFFPFVNQTSSSTFDPAAWCLKRITLPSGGEIHVQYEQNDYQFVQDKRAMVMVPLSASTTTDESGLSDKKYYLDLTKIGINLGTLLQTERDRVIRDMFSPMNADKERMYFNFLYALLGSTPDFESTKSDYLEGYARISGYGYDAIQGLAYFTFKGGSAAAGSGSFHDDITYDSKVSKREMPRKVCRDFLKSQRMGKINGEANALEEAHEQGATGEDIINAFITLWQNSSPIANECKYMKPEMSYVKVQMPDIKKKLGGGVRVKRLLMYDDGVEPGDPNSLYGQEYDYTTTLDPTNPNSRVISSGVASNEPAEGRRESPLVKPIDKDDQKWYEAILFGRDMYSQEGPIGESLLPGASIGYSKVTVSSIHTGSTSTGSEVNEFYTCRDYPFLADRTDIDQVFKTKLGAAGALGPVGGSYTRQNPYLAQGYVFISNAMHGQPKRKAKYAVGVTDKALAEEIYEYYQPNDDVQMMEEGLNVRTVKFKEFGKETEVLAERRQVTDVSVGANVGIDISTGIFTLPLPPYTFPGPYATNVDVGFEVNEKILHTHVVSKVINYPTVLKRVINIADGVKNITENLVLDKYTGTPVVTKTYDDFGAFYHNHDYMASYSHENLRSKAINTNLSSEAKFVAAVPPAEAYLDFSATGNCTELYKFVKGDLLELSESSARGLYHVDEVDVINKKLIIVRSGMDNNSIVTYNNTNVDVRVIRSGYTNQLSAKQGNIMTHGRITPISINNASSGAVQNLVNSLNSLLPGIVAGASPTVVDLPEDICLTNYTGAAFSPEPTHFEVSLNAAGDLLTIRLVNIENGASTSLCYQSFGITSGQVSEASFYAHTDGYLYFLPTACSTGSYIDCFKFCISSLSVEKVISAAAVVYKDNWPYTASLYPAVTGAFVGNQFETGTEGKWRPAEQYVYRENINTASEKHNFEEGRFTMTMFDWKNTANNNSTKWVLTSTTTKYTPNGEPVEDKNILNVYSTSKFGYNNTLPVLVAQNAADHTVAYESFENKYTIGSADYFEDGLTYNSALGTYTSLRAHTGKHSIRLVKNAKFPVATVTTSSSTWSEGGLVVRAWLFSPKTEPAIDTKVKAYYTSVDYVQMKKIASAGEWCLYEGKIEDLLTTGNLTVSIAVDGSNAYLDDVRVQPLQSEMVCYVYDKAQRLSAVMDDQHFAMIYEYNTEGMLVRKLKETVEGVKTISETQYNTKGIAR